MRATSDRCSAPGAYAPDQLNVRTSIVRPAHRDFDTLPAPAPMRAGAFGFGTFRNMRRDAGESGGANGTVIRRRNFRDRARRLGSALVLTQIAMAASAACLVFACSRVLDRPLSPWWYAAAVLGSWCVYLRDSAASCDAEDAISQPRRAAIFRGSRFWSWWMPGISAVLGIGCVVIARPHPGTAILLGLVGTLGILHAAPHTGGGTGRLTTKRFAAVKSIVVSIAWTGAAVGLCLLESPSPIERAAVVAGIWFALLVTPVLLADSLLLDLRDRAADRAFGLHTIAVRLGPRGVHAMVGLLLAAAAIATILGAADAIDGHRSLRVGVATTLGLAVPWFGWRVIRRDEVATAAAIMAWRFLIALAVL